MWVVNNVNELKIYWGEELIAPRLFNCMLSGMYCASKWCSLAIWHCTLNLTLKQPVNLWAVFTWAFIGWNCNLRDSTLGIQPGVNCHPDFYCVNYSKPWKKNTRMSRRICGLLKGHGRALFSKIISELLLKMGSDFIQFNFKTGKLGAVNPLT